MPTIMNYEYIIPRCLCAVYASNVKYIQFCVIPCIVTADQSAMNIEYNHILFIFTMLQYMAKKLINSTTKRFLLSAAIKMNRYYRSSSKICPAGHKPEASMAIKKCHISFFLFLKQ